MERDTATCPNCGCELSALAHHCWCCDKTYSDREIVWRSVPDRIEECNCDECLEEWHVTA